MNATIFLALSIAGAFVFFLLGMLPRLLKRYVVKQAFTMIGQKALTRVQQEITLERDNYPQWIHEAEVERQAAPLRSAGFTDLGVYVAKQPTPVLIRMMVHPETYVAAHIYDHSKAGSWIEFVTRYTDGSIHTLSTLPPTGVDGPDWVRKIQADKSTPTDQLYRQFLTQRECNGIKQVAPDDVVHEFEEGYKRIMLWRMGRGISSEEVAKVAANWAKKRAASTNQ